MTKQKSVPRFHDYCRDVGKLYATGQATEQSYRPAIYGLVEDLAGKGFQVISEPTREVFGVPDLIVKRNGMPVGHIECKDVGVNLDSVENHEQMRRYRDGLPNLILTDHLEFRWYVKGERRTKIRLAHPDGRPDGITYDEAGAERVGELFNAFFSVEPPLIGNPRELAEQMAGKARMLRGSIEDVLKEERGSGPLHDLQTNYREVLIPDLTPEQFADLQAQTAVYGLFAARCLHHRAQSGAFTRQSAVFVETTPFLRDVFGNVAGPSCHKRIAWIVDDLALLLDRADMGAVLADFGGRNRRDDPVVHFYEDFLAAYDPKLRKVRGVYYTPEPVVSYIVRSVDYLLRKQLGIEDGLADKAAITFKTRTSEKQSCPRVLILDPAVGTGTFLCEVVARIRETIEKGGAGGAWPDYVKDHLLQRLFGFELLMAPYAICHLKLALALGIGEKNGGFKMPPDRRLGVFLTNALEEAHREAAGALFGHQIVREAASADSIKRDKPVMVVLGNPPYSGHSSNQGEWIKELLHGRVSEKVGDYFKVDNQPLHERNPKWLNDDYVKFIRFAQWKIERTGEGVVGFVTNHSYLDNPTFRGMRQSLMKTFDEIYLLDLHGNTKKKEAPPDGGKDENVFDIQQGVAVGLFVKKKNTAGKPAKVFHYDLWGRRKEGCDGGKYGWLAANDVKTTKWTKLSPKTPLYLFVPRDESLSNEYEVGTKITDIFPVNSVGIVTARDKLAIQWTAEDMRNTVSDFVSLPEEEARARYNLGRDALEWKVSSAQEDLRSHPDTDACIAPVLYRPFDRRYTCYTGKSRGFICRPRPKVMRHILAGANLGLCVGRAGQVTGSRIWDIVFVSRNCTDLNLFRRGGNCLFPLYLYKGKKDGQADKMRQTNIDENFIETVNVSLNLKFTPESNGDLRTSFGPEDVFHYIYAVLHSPEYRRRYADFLKSDFPRVPLTQDQALFSTLAGLGARLVALHLMEAEADDMPAFAREGANQVEKVRYVPPADGTPGQVWINDKQCFEGVAPDTWAFTVGGYRPAEQWLKNREGRLLSFDEITDYRRICAALAETPRIMANIDREIDAHGGWPLGGKQA